jgi:hypothetical protein
VFPIRIIVWQAGFISIGRLEINGCYIKLHNARTIRKWPASEGGLARVAMRGPSGVTLDDACTEEQHELVVVKIMHADQDAWSETFPK